MGWDWTRLLCCAVLCCDGMGYGIWDWIGWDMGSCAVLCCAVLCRMISLTIGIGSDRIGSDLALCLSLSLSFIDLEEEKKKN